MCSFQVEQIESQKLKMTIILFWIFITIFLLTAAFAFIALLMIFISPDRAEIYPQFTKFAWALWSAVLLEVATGVFMLWRNLFGLGSRHN